MQKENKFRAWDQDINQMLPAVDLTGPRSTHKWLGVKDVEIMQYTGLKDKNGVEIFEGDIVEFHEEPDRHKYLVQFRFGAFYLCSLEEPGECDEFMTYGMDWSKGMLDADRLLSRSVIGNFHENPELLEQKS